MTNNLTPDLIYQLEQSVNRFAEKDKNSLSQSYTQKFDYAKPIGFSHNDKPVVIKSLLHHNPLFVNNCSNLFPKDYITNASNNAETFSTTEVVD